MTNINLKNVSVWYGDGNGNTIAVCCKERNRESVKYKLYSTNNNLNNFELISTSDSPKDFDAVLYSNRIKVIPQKSIELEFIPKDDNKHSKIDELTITKIKPKSNKNSHNTLKRKPLF